MTGSAAPTSRSAAEEALHRLVTVPEARYEELLAVPAEHALQVLGARSVALSRWERDRNLLRTLVNVGALLPHEERFPRGEVYPAATDDAVARVGDEQPAHYEPASATMRDLGYVDPRTGVSVPLHLDGRLWGELWVTHEHQGTTVAADARLLAAVRLADELAGMIAVAERLQRMTRLAFEDALTGVGNRRAMDETLAHLLQADGPGATVVMVDLDDLKLVNDRGGHSAGDRAITAVADALSAAAAPVPGSVVSRVGGDEFVVLLPGPARTPAIEVVDAAARTLAALPEPVSISCGIAAVAAGAAAGDALGAADAAQYAAKAREALLVVSSDVGDGSRPQHPRRPGRRAGEAGRAPTAGGATATATVVAAIAAGLADAPTSTRSRLAWLAELLLVPFELEHWSISRADLAGARELRTSTMAIRQSTPPGHDRLALHVDATFVLDDYPLTRQAVEGHQWFSVRADDPAEDESERRVLTDMNARWVVVLGCHDEGTGWLLELYGCTPGADTASLGAVASVCLTALLGRPVTPLAPDPRRTDPA